MPLALIHKGPAVPGQNARLVRVVAEVNLLEAFAAVKGPEGPHQVAAVIRPRHPTDLAEPLRRPCVFHRKFHGQILRIETSRPFVAQRQVRRPNRHGISADALFIRRYRQPPVGDGESCIILKDTVFSPFHPNQTGGQYRETGLSADDNRLRVSHRVRGAIPLPGSSPYRHASQQKRQSEKYFSEYAPYRITTHSFHLYHSGHISLWSRRRLLWRASRLCWWVNHFYDSTKLWSNHQS